MKAQVGVKTKKYLSCHHLAKVSTEMTKQTQTIHVWYIYLHLPYFTIKNNQM